MRGQLRIDLSDNCNIRCIMCQAHNHSSPSNVSFLDFEMFKEQTAGQLADWDTIQLGNIAEPTIHPKFADFLRYIRSQTTARIHIVTNGKLLDRFADVINECECLVQISTDSLQKETHEYLRVNSNYDNLMRNLSLLDTSRTEVLLSFTLMRSNIDEYDEILQFCSTRGYQLSVFPMTLRVGNGAMIPYNLAWESLWFCKDKLKKWLKTFYGNSYNEMVQGTASGKKPTTEWLSRFTCRAHETDLMIDGRGNTLLCSMEPLPSLSEMPLDDLWNSEQAEGFRSTIANGRTPCMACDYLERCLAPSMSRLENHFDKSINTILSDATKDAIRFDSTLSDEQQFLIFLKDVAQELEVYYTWEDNGLHRAIQMTDFDHLPPQDQM